MAQVQRINILSPDDDHIIVVGEGDLRFHQEKHPDQTLCYNGERRAFPSSLSPYIRTLCGLVEDAGVRPELDLMACTECSVLHFLLMSGCRRLEIIRMIQRAGRLHNFYTHLISRKPIADKDRAMALQYAA